MTAPLTHPAIFTRHALQRMEEMNVSRAAVYDALRDPQMDYLAPRKHGADVRLACKDSIAVAYKPADRDPNRSVILTVLWNRKEFTR